MPVAAACYDGDSHSCCADTVASSQDYFVAKGVDSPVALPGSQGPHPSSPVATSLSGLVGMLQTRSISAF